MQGVTPLDCSTEPAGACWEQVQGYTCRQCSSRHIRLCHAWDRHVLELQPPELLSTPPSERHEAGQQAVFYTGCCPTELQLGACGCLRCAGAGGVAEAQKSSNRWHLRVCHAQKGAAQSL